MSSAAVLPWWSPRLWGAHALLVVALAATIALGYWQWHVSQDHRSAQVASIAHEQPRPLSAVMGHNDPFPDAALGRPVSIQGSWVPQGTLFVHQPGGYWVVSPVAVGGPGQPAIYVIRGFTRTPHAPTVAGTTSLVAWLEPDGSDTTPDPNPRDDILPSLQLSLAVPHVRQQLYSAWAVSADGQGAWNVAQTNDGTAGLMRVANPGGGKASVTTGLRNLLYAIEWWLFGCLAIYIWWRWIQEQLHPELRDGADSESAQDDAVPSQP